MDSERDDVELSSTAEYTLSQACRFKAERDQLRQRVDALEEWSGDVEDMYRDAFNELMDETKKAKRLGKLVWRLQNRLARSHRRERNLRKGMREWRDKVMGAPVRTVSAYDLLPEEDLQTLRWVREQGGLDVVKTHAELFQQLKGERDELREMCRDYKKHGAYGLMLEYRRVLNGVCKRLGLTDGTGKPEQDGVIYGELEKHLIPEGYEWPRFEDGEPVRPGDKLLDKDGDWFEAVSFVFTCDWWSVRGYQTEGFGDLNNKTRRKLEGMAYGTRVKRPAPKVLDADGVEVEVGDNLYSVEGMLKFHVSAIDKKSGRIATEAMFALDKWADPKMYTHRAPVLAADGEPLREGETVHGVNTGYAYTVTGFNPTTDEDGDPCVMVVCKTESDRRVDVPSNCLTHERPQIDSWERLEQDAGKNPFDYCRDVGHRLDTCENSEAYKARDLVRRCKELARKENNNE